MATVVRRALAGVVPACAMNAHVRGAEGVVRACVRVRACAPLGIDVVLIFPLKAGRTVHTYRCTYICSAPLLLVPPAVHHVGGGPTQAAPQANKSAFVFSVLPPSWTAPRVGEGGKATQVDQDIRTPLLLVPPAVHHIHHVLDRDDGRTRAWCRGGCACVRARARRWG
jgi:hypothetical protein